VVIATGVAVAIPAFADNDDNEPSALEFAQASTFTANTGSAIVMPDTVVTATRYPVDPRTVGSAITVITSEDLEKKQTAIVSDILRDVPGVAVSRSGGLGSQTQVRIRGAEGNHTQVIIDGVEVNVPGVRVTNSTLPT
jgi:vitamin B12 transporter